MPGMPQPGDQFSSSESAEQAVIRALVPVYGYSTRTKYDSSTYLKMFCIRNHGYYSDSVEGICSFAVVVEKDSSSGRWVVNGALSTYEHTHGPHPKLVVDPSWRPIIHKTVALEALGMTRRRPAPARASASSSRCSPAAATTTMAAPSTRAATARAR